MKFGHFGSTTGYSALLWILSRKQLNKKKCCSTERCPLLLLMWGICQIVFLCLERQRMLEQHCAGHCAAFAWAQASGLQSTWSGLWAKGEIMILERPRVLCQSWVVWLSDLGVKVWILQQSQRSWNQAKSPGSLPSGAAPLSCKGTSLMGAIKRFIPGTKQSTQILPASSNGP